MVLMKKYINFLMQAPLWTILGSIVKIAIHKLDIPDTANTSYLSTFRVAAVFLPKLHTN